jgi:hypothetical protein
MSYYISAKASEQLLASYKIVLKVYFTSKKFSLLQAQIEKL